jgi:HSP20 family protein
MAYYFSDPFETLRRFQRELDRYRTADWFGTGTANAGAYPPINVFQQGDDVVIVAEIPGVKKGDLDIQVKENRVRISGNRATEIEEGASVHRRERVAGSFDRTVAVPIEFDPDGVRAEYREGILAIHLPRAEHAKPRTVAIN